MKRLQNPKPVETSKGARLPHGLTSFHRIGDGSFENLIECGAAEQSPDQKQDCQREVSPEPSLHGPSIAKTGMEPWFEFWKAVRYAIQQSGIEWEARQAYLKETL